MLRFESLEAEEASFKRLLRLDRTLEQDPDEEDQADTSPDAWWNRNSPDQLEPEHLTQMYFAHLSEEEATGLYRIFEDDFRMFGYRFSFGELTFPIQIRN